MKRGLIALIITKIYKDSRIPNPKDITLDKNPDGNKYYHNLKEPSHRGFSKNLGGTPWKIDNFHLPKGAKKFWGKGFPQKVGKPLTHFLKKHPPKKNFGGGLGIFTPN